MKEKKEPYLKMRKFYEKSLSSNFFFKFEIIDKATRHPNIKNIREIKTRDFELSLEPEEN